MVEMNSFFSSASEGDDIITDFSSNDLLVVDLSVFADEAELLAAVTYSGSDAIVDFGNGNQVTLVGVSTLTSDDVSVTNTGYTNVIPIIDDGVPAPGSADII